ncbi:metallophosphoesterase [Roseiconus nitratireducens]|uniref:Metallophosphoesterase n=1 Tax=Roseiconus nitratireducens TaxID=2605748 RepID=A0A5M6D7T4_9BACT|nr:metallophosphoesterase [Roseiconus nitratireducens]KAA5543624.1 metallophosphoesterase [Roseiconus nitratireducens]
MRDVLPWLLLLLVLIGHGGLHIAIYNRINAIGWPRKVVKGLTKFFLLTTIGIPAVALASAMDPLRTYLSGQGSWNVLPVWIVTYSVCCLVSLLVLGIPWLLSRPHLASDRVRAPRDVDVIDVRQHRSGPLTLTSKASWQSRMPMNQLLQLSVERVELPVIGLPPELDGYRIAHLSDVHLTGDIHPEYASFAVEKATELKPNLIALTGDIIDQRSCIDWLVDIFSPAEAPDGCHFILGNHDTRVVDSWETREAMDRAGWIDLGSQVMPRTLNGVACELIGNEHPWYARPELTPGTDRFRLLLSHSPDQFSWARRHGVHLMLAGHTHGGQGRLPLIGPVLSPSFHGSRYASGQFYRRPTTLFVTRGLGGVHLFRINCRPELALLTLRRMEASGP